MKFVLAYCVIFTTFNSQLASSSELEMVRGMFPEDTKFFWDTAMRTRDNSDKACKGSPIPNAGLAIMNKDIFETILISDFPPNGTYWIDGTQAATGGAGFESTSECSASKDAFDLTGVQIKKPNDVPYCLALVKVTGGFLNTYITEYPCSTQLRVLCSYSPGGTCA